MLTLWYRGPLGPFQVRGRWVSLDDDYRRCLILRYAVACMLAIGISIGSGIFSAPSGVLVGVGSVGMSLIMWAAGIVFGLCSILAYVELGTVSNGFPF